MTPTVYDPQDFDVYIGNDVDQKSFALTIRSRSKIMSKKIPASPEQLDHFIKNQFPDKRVIVGYEAGPTGFGLYDYLMSHDQRCIVMSPASVRRAANQKVKTNRIDSRHLTNMLYEGDFNPVRVPGGEYRELRHLVQSRENYARLQKVSKQRIKALLLLTGLQDSCQDIETRWSNLYVGRLKTINCTPAVRFQLDRLLDDLGYARGQLSKATKQLREFCSKNDEIKEHIQNLISIPGIGLIVATTVLGRIGDPRELKDFREISSFCGLVPCENSTGDTVRRSSITHMGNRNLRRMLVEASWVVIRKDKELEQFFHRIASRHHIQYARQKAIVAVAHKLTQRIYCVLTERRKYIAR
jgi:transposase